LVTADPPDRQSEAATHADTAPVEELSELQRMRVERDAALEELAFLREQLRSTEAFYAHRFELEYTRLYAEHRAFLEQLTRLSAEFHRRARRDDPMREDARTAPSDPTDATLLPQER
jgi:hypothetical protein